MRSVDVYPPSVFGGSYNLPAGLLPGPVVIEGIDWGDPHVRFSRGSAVAFSDPYALPAGLRGRFVRRFGQHTGVAAFSYGVRSGVRYGFGPISGPGADPPGHVGSALSVPPADADRSSHSDIPGGGHYGLRALLSDQCYHDGLAVLGPAPTLADLIGWASVDPVRFYSGEFDVFADLGPAAGGPYPERFYCRRRRGGRLKFSDVAGNWRGKAGILDAGPPGVWM
jgi:hypothetical protein